MFFYRPRYILHHHLYVTHPIFIHHTNLHYRLTDDHLHWSSNMALILKATGTMREGFVIKGMKVQ